MNQTYNITLTGELIGEIERSDAIAVFAKLFKLPLDKAHDFFHKAPLVVKKSVDGDTANKIQQILEKSGLHCEINPVEVVETEQSTQVGVMSESAVDAQDEQSGQEREEMLDSESEMTTEPEQPSASFKGLKFEMAGQPDYGFVTVHVPAGEMLKVEASAMATMDTNMQMKTKMRGGLGRMVTGENIFVNEFTAANMEGEVGIAPGAPGDLCHQYLDNETIYLQNSAFVACSSGIEVESKWQGLVKGFFSGESLFLIRAQGKGDLWFNSYGAIIEIDVNDDYVVDTGNIVGFTDGLEYQITKVGGYKSFFFSGEGLVCRFSGKGKVWIQTRSSAAFVGWAHWFRPVKSKG
ncbi:TIGR00266 family protein [Shewanella nanhaiensis]|uniref:TIGR00266 family protein n=1 Tax=Shewanella nanhaiensis TaxID=2864872 RepID=A0ABS7E4Y3_9GAMM|nr:TIGR00266 family protein [Shewanella nanhaiensis]MBW8184600.1 TIGR00266 family protein [Shewanella nanhaiensis]